MTCLKLKLKPIHLVVAPLVIAAMFAMPRAAVAQDLHASDQDAFQAFLKAAERGEPRAQRRLAEIYDRGNAAVGRDYVEAIRWYQKAREQGEQISPPLRRSYGLAGYGG